jgi:serine protease Do
LDSENQIVEIVETYPPQPVPREVVEFYLQPRRMPGRRKTPPLLPVLPAAMTAKAEPAQEKKSRKSLWVFLTCMAVVLILAGTAMAMNGLFVSKTPADSAAGSQEQTNDTDEEKVSIPKYPFGQGAEMTMAEFHGDALTAQEVYARVNPAVVTVMAELGYGTSVGTGVIFRQDGYVLTNFHVVAGSGSCNIALADGQTFEAKYVGGDSGNDVAVLKLEGEDFPTAEIGSSDILTVGDQVFAIGNPLGVQFRGTFTNGIVSAIDRDVKVKGRTMTLIQTDAALNAGNSGGPLINVYGQVVGVNTIKMMSFTTNIEGLGFALPMMSVQKLVNDILEFGEIQPEPRIGILARERPETLPDGTTGVMILEITPEGAAEEAGLMTGDVITSAGGQHVATRSELLGVRRQFHVGEDMDLTFYRDGKFWDVTLHLNQAVSDEEGE